MKTNHKILVLISYFAILIYISSYTVASKLKQKLMNSDYKSE